VSKIGVISRMMRSSRRRAVRDFTSAAGSFARAATEAKGSGSRGKLD
jgi:hypothetical protein